MSDLAVHADTKIATVIGATGLIGKALVELLLSSAVYSSVVIIARKAPQIASPKLVYVPMPPQHTEEAIRAVLPKGDDFFSCLGTTRKQAGSAEAFKAIDFKLNFAFAKTAQQVGYNQYLLVSSVGADPLSGNLYSRVKGRLELSVKALPFWSIHIFQPSLLLGQRDELRWGERLATPIANFFSRIAGDALGKYKPVDSSAVAKAMFVSAQQTKSGTYTYLFDQIEQLALQNTASSLTS